MEQGSAGLTSSSQDDITASSKARSSSICCPFVTHLSLLGCLVLIQRTRGQFAKPRWLVHPAHTMIVACAGRDSDFILLNLGDEDLGSQHQGDDGSCILQREAC